MSKLTHPLKLALRSVFQPRGYEFFKGAWIRRFPAVVQSVHLDKSPDGEKYYLDAAFWLVDVDTPPEWFKRRFGQYSFRIDSHIDPEFDELLNVFLNEYIIRPEERETRFRKLLESKAIPLLDQLTTVDQLRDAYLTQKIRNVAIVREASLFLFGTEIMPLSRGGYLYKADNDDLRDRERDGGK